MTHRRKERKELYRWGESQRIREGRGEEGSGIYGAEQRIAMALLSVSPSISEHIELMRAEVKSKSRSDGD